MGIVINFPPRGRGRDVAPAAMLPMVALAGLLLWSWLIWLAGWVVS